MIRPIPLNVTQPPCTTTSSTACVQDKYTAHVFLIDGEREAFPRGQRDHVNVAILAQDLERPLAAGHGRHDVVRLKSFAPGRLRPNNASWSSIRAGLLRVKTICSQVCAENLGRRNRPSNPTSKLRSRMLCLVLKTGTGLEAASWHPPLAQLTRCSEGAATGSQRTSRPSSYN